MTGIIEKDVGTDLQVCPKQHRSGQTYELGNFHGKNK